jgi:ABC-type Fe3+/spermidine/putrescine transport system ATPase subunit
MISFDAVTKDFAGRRAAGPLSITIEKGQFVALLGGSGCG